MTTTMTMTLTAAQEAALAAVRPFAGRDRRGAGLLRLARLTNAGGTTTAAATDLESACVVILRDAGAAPADVLIDSTGAPAGGPEDYPAVGGRLDPAAVTAAATIRWRDLARIAALVAPVCDWSSARYVLGCVRLESDGRLLHAIGTDGLRMHILTVPSSAPGTVAGTVAAQLDGAAVTRFARAVRAAVRATGLGGRRLGAALAGADVSITTSTTEVVIEVCCGGATARLRCRQPEGRYPRWRDICDCYRDGWRVESRIDAAHAAACYRGAAAYAAVASRSVPGARPDGRVRVGARIEEDHLVVMRPSSPTNPTGPVVYTSPLPIGWPTTAGRPAKVSLDPAFAAAAFAAAGEVAADAGDAPRVMVGRPIDPVCLRAGGHGRAEGEWGIGFTAVIAPMV